MATILDGLQRGANRSRSYFDRQTSRRLAAEQGAREQSKFDSNALIDADNKLFAQGRREGFIVADPETGRLSLSKTFDERLAAGDAAAQDFGIQIANRGSGRRVPSGFQIDEFKSIKGEDGVTRYAVGGANEDGSRGVLTVDGSSEDTSVAKQFDGTELAGFARLAFNARDGFLYNQNVVDLNSYQNSLDLIAGQKGEEVIDAFEGNPEVQRAAAAVIANSETDEERVENINKLAVDAGVEPIPAEVVDQAKTQSDSDPESATESAPTDNSAQIAKLEKELAAIEGRKTGTSRANVRAAERKRAEIQRLKDDSEPEPESKGITGRVLAGRNRASGGSPIPPIVEEAAAPVVEGKTIKQIDEGVDDNKLAMSPEIAQAAAENLQAQGVNSAEDLVKLDDRQLAYAYAFITASTPAAQRPGVRDKLINLLETGVSDRGDSVMKAQQIQNTRDRLILDSEEWIDKLSQRGATVANEALQEIIDTIYPVDEETGLSSQKRLTVPAANTLANRTFPKLMQALDQFEASKNYAAYLQAKPVLNQAVSFVVQGLAADGSPGLLASLGALFNPDASGNYDADLSNIFLRDGKLIYTQADKPVGKPVSIGQLRGINDNLASLVVASAKLNQAAKDAEKANKG